MVAYDPTHRASIAEICGHPWFQGKIATKEDIISEFNKRRNVIEEISGEDEGDIKEKSAEKNNNIENEMKSRKIYLIPNQCLDCFREMWEAVKPLLQ